LSNLLLDSTTKPSQIHIW